MNINWSTVLIARNEEKTLPRLLRSLKPFMDQGGEVIVVDTGSTDKTVEVAKKHGCKVTEVGDRFVTKVSKEMATEINSHFIVEKEASILKEGDRIFDYSSARNFAASLASNDMVAMPDADEEYTTLDLQAISDVISAGFEQLEYNFVFAHDDQGRPTIEFLHCKFYNRTKLEWVGVIHEVLKGDAKRTFLDSSVIKLEHFQNHETDRSGYLRGLAIDCYRNPENDRNSHYLGRELLWTGRPQSAIWELKRHVAMEKWPAERSQSFVFMGQAHEQLNDEKNALNAYHEAIRVDCSRREPFIRLAEYYHKRNDHQRTAVYALASLGIKQSGFYADNGAHYREVPHELLYWAFWYLGDKEKSREHFEKAISYVPNHPKYLQDSQFYVDLPTVSFVIPTLGREEGLKKCLESIGKLNYPAEKIDICVLDDPNPTVPEKVADGVGKTSGAYIVYAANDTEFPPDSLKTAILSSIMNKKRLVAFHSEDILPDEGNICAHFVIKRDLIAEIDGEVFDTGFTHVGVDNLLWAKCKKLGEAHHESTAVITHNHFSKGSEYDWVYKRGWENADRDRALLKLKLANI